jgi:hypothetical protein
VVLDECLDYALENNIKHGIWGGMTENEREKVRTVLAKQGPEAAESVILTQRRRYGFVSQNSPRGK